jgi:hypothetical protein
VLQVVFCSEHGVYFRTHVSVVRAQLFWPGNGGSGGGGRNNILDEDSAFVFCTTTTTNDEGFLLTPIEILEWKRLSFVAPKDFLFACTKCNRAPPEVDQILRRLQRAPFRGPKSLCFIRGGRIMGSSHCESFVGIFPC